MYLVTSTTVFAVNNILNAELLFETFLYFTQVKDLNPCSTAGAGWARWMRSEQEG